MLSRSRMWKKVVMAKVKVLVHNRRGWSISSTLNMYSGGIQFHYWQDYQMSWSLLWFYSVFQCKHSDTTHKQLPPFESLPTHYSKPQSHIVQWSTISSIHSSFYIAHKLIIWQQRLWKAIETSTKTASSSANIYMKGLSNTSLENDCYSYLLSVYKVKEQITEVMRTNLHHYLY